MVIQIIFARLILLWSQGMPYRPPCASETLTSRRKVGSVQEPPPSQLLQAPGRQAPHHSLCRLASLPAEISDAPRPAWASAGSNVAPLGPGTISPAWGVSVGSNILGTISPARGVSGGNNTLVSSAQRNTWDLAPNN